MGPDRLTSAAAPPELERFPAVLIFDKAGPQFSRGIAGEVASGALIAQPPGRRIRGSA